MVAGMRYLETQSRLLRRTDATSSDFRYAKLNTGSSSLFHATSGFGIAGTLQSDVRLTQTIYFMFGNGGFADTAAALSLITDLVATFLIAIKALYVTFTAVHTPSFTKLHLVASTTVA